MGADCSAGAVSAGERGYSGATTTPASWPSNVAMSTMRAVEDVSLVSLVMQSRSVLAVVTNPGIGSAGICTAGSGSLTASTTASGSVRPMSDSTSVTCPLHAWVFDLETGRAQGADAGAVVTHPAEVVDGRIRLDLSRLASRKAA